jgi:T4-like virus tail tube protein gp19
MANITGFKASMVNGLVRPNNFQVDLTFPSFVTGGTAASILGQFHCKAASLPASTVQPVPVYYQGRSINVAGERDFQPWSIMVYTENFAIRDAFERWSNGINNLSNNSGIIQPALYQTDMYVKQLERNGSTLKEIKLIDAMPVEIGPIQLDWEANNQVEVFEVTFVYNYYESSGVNA